MQRTLILSSVCALVLIAAMSPPRDASQDQTRRGRVLVRASRIYTGCENGTAAMFTPGAMLVGDGKVVAVGQHLEVPVDASVVDLGSAVLMPGIVAATSSLVGDSQNVDSISAQIRAVDGFALIADYRSQLLGGATTVYLSPGVSRLVSGQGAIVKLSGKEGRASILRDAAFLEINLGSSSLGPPPKTEFPIPPSADNPIKPSLVQLPTTRLGQLLGIREAFAMARDEKSRSRMTMTALAQAIERRTPLRIRAEESADLLRAIELAQELKHPAVLCGAKEGVDVADALASSGLKVIVELSMALTTGEASYDPDALVLHPETAARLREKGVAVAVSTPFGGALEDLLLAGAVAMRGGLGRDQAIAAMTRVPAEILGVADRVGSLAPGKDADFLVLSDEPFARGCHVLETWVEGRLAVAREALFEASDTASVVIRAGTILTGDSAPIHDGAVLMREGKIASVGRMVAVPPGARVVDAGDNATVTPGFIDANSHLEFGSERANLSLENDLTLAISGSDDNARMVARGGVTAVMLQTWTTHTSGTRVAPIKTVGDKRGGRVLDWLAAVRFAWPDDFDPVDTEARFDGLLKAGQDYHQKWKKYQEDLAKWKEEKAKGTAPAPPPPPKEEKPEQATEKRADPLTGKWDVTISGGPMPEPQKGVMNLKLEGEKVTGTFAALFGDDEDPAAINGTFSSGHLLASLEVETPMGKPQIDAQVSNDRMNGTVGLGPQFRFNLEAVRTETTYTEVTVVGKSKKKSAEGEPEAPEANPALEPYRRVFDLEVPVVLEVNSPIVVRRALSLFVDKYKVNLVLLGGRGLLSLPPDSIKKVKGVIAPVQVEARWGDDLVVPAQEFAAAGIPVAFQSDGATAAQGLALSAAYAVRKGLDPQAALRGLTIDAARIFQVDDRIGSIAPGRDGDVLVFSGDPFDVASRLLHVFVGGREVPLKDED